MVSRTYRREFTSRKRAQTFVDILKKDGRAEDVICFTDRDAFGQRRYTVAWNLYEEEEQK